MGRPVHPHIITPDSALGGKDIVRSLRFKSDDNTRLTRTIGSTSNRRTFTYSWWLKRTMKSAEQYVWYVGSSSGTPYLDARFEANGHQLQIQDYTPSRPLRFITNRQFRDSTSWYHFVFAVDTTQGTASNRAKLYVNGVQETSFSTETYPSQNFDTSANVSGNLQVWGTNKEGTSNDLDGYLAEAHFVDGQQLTPSSFGFTEPQTGIWMPKEYEGTYGTNGFYLDFSDNSAATATTIGKDRSGNANDFTPSNFSVSAGAGNDSFPDTPTNNFCTMNPLVISPNVTHANGNLDLSGSASDSYSQSNLSTFGVSSGKWYAEVKITYSTTNVYVGVCPITTPGNTNLTGSVTDAAVLRMSNTTYIEGTETGSIFDSISSGDIIGIALDMDNLRVWFSKNGTYANSGNPDTGTNAIFSGITAGETMAIAARPLNGTLNFNFGQRPFSYTPPTGYKAWTSNHLLTNNPPSVLDPKKHFDTLLYTTGSSNGTFTHTGVGFKPDLMWVKCRNANESNFFIDSVRGDQAVTNKFLRSNDEGGEGTAGTNGTTWTTIKGGFTVTETSIDNSNGGGELYYSSRNYVAWCWKAGGSSNTFNIDDVGYATVSAAGLDGGSINPTGASVNTEAGFSIITYTGTGSAGTISHGLGKAPAWVITKRRNANQAWFVHHKDISNGHYLRLNNTNQQGGDTNVYPNNMSTTNTFAVGGDDGVNGNGSTYVSYCWAEVPGYSKFGVFTGNGNDDGTFVYTGFRPAWIVIKNRNANGFNWVLQDNKRSPFNLCDDKLNPDANNTEQTNYDKLDMLADGFKLRQNASGSNANGSAYVYMAFAEQPGGVTPYTISSNAR